MNIIEMREKRANLWDSAKKYHDAHIGSDGTMPAEDAQIYDKMVDDVDRMRQEIERMERQDAIESEMNKPTASPLVSAPETNHPPMKKGRSSDAYQQAFWNQVRRISSPEIRDAPQEGTDTEGGYLVPDTYEARLIDALKEANVVRSLAHSFTTSYGDHKIPVVTSHGNASWVEEEGEIGDSDDVFGQQIISAHKVATLIKVSEELLQDSAFDLENYFRMEFARRIGEKEEDAFINGNGTHKPLGFLAATGGAQTGVTTAAADKITADELIDLYYSLKAPYRANAVWLLNDSTMKQIRKLKSGDGQYIWQPALREGGYDTLLGKPIRISPFFPEIGAGNKSVAFGNFDYYWIGDRQGISFRRLNEKYATTGQVGFLATRRLDARLIVPEAIKVMVQHA